MIYRDQHTHLTITTAVLDASAFTTLVEDLCLDDALAFLATFTSLLETRITEIAHALTQHSDQDAQKTQDTSALMGAPVLMDAVLNLRAGASMAGALRIHLLLTTALNDIRTGCIAPGLLVDELRKEAHAFKAEVTRLHHPSAQAA